MTDIYYRIEKKEKSIAKKKIESNSDREVVKKEKSGTKKAVLNKSKTTKSNLERSKGSNTTNVGKDVKPISKSRTLRHIEQSKENKTNPVKERSSSEIPAVKNSIKQRKSVTKNTTSKKELNLNLSSRKQEKINKNKDERINRSVKGTDTGTGTGTDTVNVKKTKSIKERDRMKDRVLVKSKTTKEERTNKKEGGNGKKELLRTKTTIYNRDVNKKAISNLKEINLSKKNNMIMGDNEEKVKKTINKKSLTETLNNGLMKLKSKNKKSLSLIPEKSSVTKNNSEEIHEKEENPKLKKPKISKMIFKRNKVKSKSMDDNIGIIKSNLSETKLKSGASFLSRYYTCYLCGMQFGSTSLKLHIPKCQQHWIENEAMKERARDRRKLPDMPKSLDLDNLPTDRENIDKFNQVMVDYWKYMILYSCDICGRTFKEEAFEKHKKLCSKESPGGPHGLSKRLLEHNKNIKESFGIPRHIKSQSCDTIILPPKKYPKFYFCYLCGNQFGSQSLSIHIPQCQRLWEEREMKKEKKDRRPLPDPPVELNLESLPKDGVDIEAFNNIMYNYWSKISLIECKYCKRTFRFEAFEKHKNICTEENPFPMIKA